MPVKQYRIVTNSLAIRSQPQLNDSTKTGLNLRFGDMIVADDDSRTQSEGLVWLKHDRGWSAERTADGKTTYMLDASLRPREKMWGINIDPYNPAGNPPASKLQGVGWVRFVFHISGQRQTIEQAFNYYDPIINAYQRQGTKVLLVIIQDTYWGNAPWQNGDWGSYIAGYCDTLRRIATRYRGKVAGYEIWNEPDLPTAQQNPITSIFIEPQIYASLLRDAARTLRESDPQTKVVSAGLVGPDPIAYLNTVKQTLGGSLPVDAIGIHPYGQRVPEAPIFDGFGLLSEYITRMTASFPNIPLWITEYGVPRVNVNDEGIWPRIAAYMRFTFQLIRGTYFFNVPVVIWFGWADSMDNAGIVKDNQQPKGVIYEQFVKNTQLDIPNEVRAVENPYAGKVMLAHVAGQFVQENSIGELAERVFLSGGRANAILAKTSAGPLWIGRADSKRALAINSQDDLRRWTTELSKFKLDFHAWHDISGRNLQVETQLIAQIALTPGVDSVVLDLNVSLLILRQSGEIRAFMTALKRLLPTIYHIGLSFDGRPESFGSVNLTEWYPFINSWHPKIFHWQFSQATQDAQPYLAATFEALKPFPRPIVPVLQAEKLGDRPVPPAQIQQAASLAFNAYRATGVTFWRIGALNEAEYAVIRTINPAGNEDVLTVQNIAMNIRSAPDLGASVVGVLRPNDRLTVLEHRIVNGNAWVRHAQGWTVAKLGKSGEVLLS